MNHASPQHNLWPDTAHVDWIDCAKGLTIALVVMLYANEWAESDPASNPSP